MLAASDGKAHWSTNPESSLLGAIDGKADGATDPEGSLYGARDGALLGGEPHDFVGNKQLLRTQLAYNCHLFAHGGTIDKNRHRTQNGQNLNVAHQLLKVRVSTGCFRSREQMLSMPAPRMPVTALGQEKPLGSVLLLPVPVSNPLSK